MNEEESVFILIIVNNFKHKKIIVKSQIPEFDDEEDF